MATSNTNGAYLAFGSKNLSGYWTDEISFEQSTDTEDTTAGAGATHVQRAAKLIDTSMSFMVVYDATDLATYRSALVVGTTDVLVWGPEGSGAGKPKFEGSMILTSVSGPSQSIDKSKMMFELQFEQAAAPIGTIAGGHTFGS